MQYQWTLIVALAVVLGFFSPTLIAEDNNNADRAVYNQLKQQAREVHRQLADAKAKGVKEAKNNNGEVSMETKAEMVSLRDRLDRKMTRLTLVALRHAWEIPDFSKEENSTSSPAKRQIAARQQVFAAADQMVSRTLNKEALAIASRVSLPLIRLELGEK